MKKILALLLAAVSTVGMYAAIDSHLRLYFIKDADDKEVYTDVAIGDSYAPFDAHNCADYAPQLGNASNIGMYVQYAGANYMALNAPELVNVPVAVVTSREAAALQEYTFYVDFLSGHSVDVYLTDLRPDGGGAPVTINLNTISGDDGYSFSLASESAYEVGQNSVIADRFVLNYDPSVLVSLTTNEEGWASFAYSANVVPVDNSLKMYKGAINDEVLSLTEVGYVKAGEGVIAKGNANTTYDFMHGTAYANYNSNDLIGCPVATPVLAGTNFVLSYKNGATAFYEYTGSEIPAHKAYLNFPASTPAPQRIRMVINQEQAIENVTLENVKAEKFVENGQIYIRRGNEVYNLQGQKVNF